MGRAYLQVVGGMHVGKSVALPLGELLRIGRSANTEIALCDDSGLLAEHCGVMFDGTAINAYGLSGGEIRKSGGESGPLRLVSGERFSVGGSEIECWIPGKGGGACTDDGPSPLREVRRRLDDYEGEVYAILDSAKQPAVGFLESLGCEFASLYQGRTQERLAEVAPYLVGLPRGSMALAETIRWMWGHSCGVFLCAQGTFGEVRKHLRHFLQITNARGGKSLYRFYDPRVLRGVIPTLGVRELNNFWGPIDRFYVEGRTTGELLSYDVDGLQGVDAGPVFWEERSSVESGLLIREFFALARGVEAAGVWKSGDPLSGAEVARANFLSRVLDYARREMPTVTGGIPAEELKERIGVNAIAASQFGCYSEAGLAAFICLGLAFGPDFVSVPSVRECVDAIPGNADEKVIQFAKELQAEGRREKLRAGECDEYEFCVDAAVRHFLSRDTLGISPGGLASLTAMARERGERFGLEAAPHIGVLAVAILVFGQNLELVPRMRLMLAGNQRSSTEKVIELADAVTRVGRG